MVKKEAGGPWDCYQAYNFFGWEAERVVAVIRVGNIMEPITRAKTHLSVMPPRNTSRKTQVWLKRCN